MRPDHPGNWRATRSLIDVFCTRTRGHCRRLLSSEVRASYYKGHCPKWVPRRVAPRQNLQRAKEPRPKLEQRRTYPRYGPSGGEKFATILAASVHQFQTAQMVRGLRFPRTTLPHIVHLGWNDKTRRERSVLGGDRSRLTVCGEG